MTWSWKTSAWTRKLWVLDGRILSHLVAQNISLENFPDSLTRTARKCPSSGDNTRNCSVRRAARVSPWVSCTGLCWGNTRQSRMTSVYWVKGERETLNKYISLYWTISWILFLSFSCCFDVSCHIIQIWWPGHLPLCCSCQVRAFSGELQYSYCFSIKARASNLRYWWGIGRCFECMLLGIFRVR